VRLSYDSRDPVRNKTWQVVKGCVEGLPCWDDGEGPVIPYDNDSSGIHTVDPMGWVALICYLLGFLLVVSVVFNVQLSNQIKRIQWQQQHQSSQQTYSRSNRDPFSRRLYSREGDGVGADARTDLEEPLLSTSVEQDDARQEAPARQVQFSTSAFDALDTAEPSEPAADDAEVGGAEETKDEAE
jgi:hypothetical protein